MEKKNSFLKGALCGALAMLLIAVLAGSGILFAGTVWNKIKSEENGTEQKIQEMRALIEQVYLHSDEVDDKQLEEALIKGYVSGLGDPYSVYYNAEETKELLEATSGEFSGLGVSISQDYETKIMTFVNVYEDSAGAEAGFQEGDILYKVDGEDVSGQDLGKVVSKIKGEEGTKVTITVLRGEQRKEYTATATRKKFEARTIEAEMKTQQIGYIRVMEFDEVTYEQFQTALKELQGMKALVIDLRNNPGGNMDTVCKMLDLILPKGKIVYTEDKNGERNTYDSDEEHQLTVPLAVLVNGKSASASEIFAGAVQDYGIGKIVGTTTFGKGVVQQIFPMTDGTSVKLTISEYFTPKGRNIHGKGIEPDVEVEYEYQENDEEADNQLEKALAVVGEQIGN